MQTDPPPQPAQPAQPSSRRRRDRRGRGIRGQLAPANVPLHRSRAERFDDLVMDAVEEIEEHWATELAPLEFAVEEVPPNRRNGSPGGIDDSEDTDAADAADAVVERGITLGRLFRNGLPDLDPSGKQPVIVVYRRPIEARALDPEDRADLVFMVVADLAAEYLGRDPEEF